MSRHNNNATRMLLLICTLVLLTTTAHGAQQLHPCCDAAHWALGELRFVYEHLLDCVRQRELLIGETMHALDPLGDDNNATSDDDDVLGAPEIELAKMRLDRWLRMLSISLQHIASGLGAQLGDVRVLSDAFYLLYPHPSNDSRPVAFSRPPQRMGRYLPPCESFFADHVDAYKQIAKYQYGDNCTDSSDEATNALKRASDAAYREVTALLDYWNYSPPSFIELLRTV